jgi:uncharacterized protein involved in exopolysaccharide biosynthesis
LNQLVKIEPAFPVSTSETATLFADVVTAFFRNKLKIMSAALVFLLLVSCVFIFRTTKYESRMLFLVRDEASTFPTDSFDEHTQPPPDSLATDMQIGTEIELLSGSDLHRQVITNMNPGLSNADVDRRLLAFDKDLNVLPVPKTRLISVSYLSSSKEEGKATLAALSRAYLAYRAAIKGSDGAYAFFDQQARRYSEEVQEDQAALATFNQRYQISLLTEEKDLTVHRLSDARANLYENEASLGEAGKKIQTMSATREKLPRRVIT